METDSELLNAARRMDKTVLVKILDQYSSALYNYALRLCGDPSRADHIVGDVFAKLLEQLSEGDGPQSNLRSYLFQMVYHQIVDEARSARHWAPLDVADFLGKDAHSNSLSVEDQLLFKQIIEVMRKELTDDQRHVIFLRFLEEFSLAETAIIMGKTIENIKVLQNRALVKLRRALERQEIQKVTSSPRIPSFPKVLRI